MQDARLAAFLALLLVPACAAPEEPLAVAPPCASAHFPDDRFIGPAFTDKFNGRYSSGSHLLDVRREDQRLFIGPPQGAWRQLERTGAIPGEGAFRDGCGRTYLFILPPDGPGAMLIIAEPDGTRSEWHRV